MNLVLVAMLLLGPSCEPSRRALSLGPSPNEASDSEAWRRLLTCALAETADCRLFVESTLRGSASGIDRQLAAVVLEEWGLLRSDPRLHRARQVWIPLPSLEELTALLPSTVEQDFILLSGVVLPDGTVTSVELLRESHYQALNEVITRAFSAGRYRPARDKAGKYISQRLEYLYRLDPHY